MNKSANKYFWVTYWLEKFGPSFEEAEVTAEQREDGKWVCQIQIPLVNKTVKSVSTTEINALYNASEKAATLIDEYLLSHPELVVKNRFKRGHYEFKETPDGKFKYAGLTSEYRQKEGDKMLKMMTDSFKAVERAIARIKTINGSDKGLFIQVVDKTCFSKESDEREIQSKVYDIINNEYGDYMGVGSVIIENHVITVGYTFERKGDEHGQN